MSKFNLNNKVAIVTGAGRGIGKAIALGLAEAGANVVLASRTREQLEELAEEIKYVKTLVVPADVTKVADVKNLLNKTLEAFRKVDILINNAGITIKKPALEMQEEDWQKIMDINLKGEFLCARIIGEQMVKQKSGSIINMASVGGHLGLIGSLGYCATKGGILQMTRVLASEWAKDNVRVNAVSPGYVETELVEGAMSARPELREKIINRTPMGRLAKPEEIVGASIFLASDASTYVTGISLIVDGGMSAFGV
ncbi:gluconate 5-dehydrogenase [Desulfotomaculum arcticum]|uniref:Gluconate 5-dehydrogenase n=1 Tax=Desulfotruncus arcticus DSM 17038 TaxID=1121424 RepID=A0A1I2TNK9_9FIRM|nr:3-oxoacyl-ACP reductase family protein [Desulfotruncus arcticus]SFG63921.1 gluconate 5-dehydrogenase [Desulfotomaculum arcticum] [Desulfotruncus arcticus DSM 17038]